MSGETPEPPSPGLHTTVQRGLEQEDPFSTPVEDRRADRRFRGRMVAPVTVWTAGSRDRRAGLTVSSLLVAEGDPAELLGLIDPLSELSALIGETRTFAVHVLDEQDRRLAGNFAGVYPVDPFAEVDFTDGEFGPVLSEARHFLGCRLVASAQVGLQTLVRGRVESLRIVEEGGPPLIRYRGRYRKLAGE